MIRKRVSLFLTLLAVIALQRPVAHAQASAQQGAPGRAVPSASPASSLPGGGMVTIESDTQQADNRSGVVTAIGNVRISYPQRGMVATARQAQYYTREGKLILSGDVDVVDRDGQRIRAERLVYHLDSERLRAEPAPGSQVTTRLRLQMSPARPAGAPRPAPMPQPGSPAAP